MSAPTCADWQVWGCEASVVVTEADSLGEAVFLVRSIIDETDRACNRFRNDSELSLAGSQLSTGFVASAWLVKLVEAALTTAVLTDGDVDPTLGNRMNELGYDRDFTLLKPWDGLDGGTTLEVARRRAPGWKRVSLAGSVLTVPPDLLLDLGATGKALTVDRAAEVAACATGCGVLVNIGGDIAVCGPGPADGWQILVQDLPTDPAQQVSLHGQSGIATSSTQKRRWSLNGGSYHHILDPRLGLPAPVVWRSVTVAADTCLQANAYSTAAIIRGLSAVQWLNDIKVSARFVDCDGRVVTTGTWPAPGQMPLTGQSRGQAVRNE